MTYIAPGRAVEYIGGKSNADIRAMAYNTYEVSFPELMAAYVDPDRDVYMNNRIYTAEEKTLPGGVAAFNMEIQTITNAFTAAYKIFELQLNDVNLIKPLYGG